MAQATRRVAGVFVAVVILAAGLALQSTPARAIDIKEVVSPGGIKAWLVEDHTNPVLSMEFAFEGGSALDPEGKAGLARMVASTMDEGAGDLDSQAFQLALEERSIGLSFSAGQDGLYGELQTLTQHRARAFELLALALTKPRFNEEAVERIRAQIQAGLARSLTNPNTIAWRTFYKVIFPDHPYGTPSDGTPASIAAITIDDIRSFAAERLAKSNLLIGVTGDITAEELKPLLDSTFGGLPDKAAGVDVAAAEVGGAGATVVVDHPVPQTAIVVGHEGIKRDHPDYYAATIVNYVLGGGSFASRLFEEVREKRGLAYSVWTGLSTRDHAGLVVGGAGTANARVKETLDVMRQEWAEMAENGPTAEELADAKTYLTGSFPLRLTSTGSIASLLVGVQLEDLGIDYINRRNDLIEAVTLEDAKRVAADLLHPEKLTIVTVGQPEGVQATIEAPKLEGT